MREKISRNQHRKQKRINHISISFEISLYIASNFQLQIFNTKKCTSYIYMYYMFVKSSSIKQLILPLFNHVESLSNLIIRKVSHIYSHMNKYLIVIKKNIYKTLRWFIILKIFMISIALSYIGVKFIINYNYLCVVNENF